MHNQQLLPLKKKSSSRGLRMILVVLGVVLMISIMFIIGIVASSFYAESHRPTVGDAMNVSSQYYKAIQQHDYTTAYSALNKNATITIQSRPDVMNSVDTLATASKTLDTRNGMISNYTATEGHFEQGTNIVDLTMQVTRTSQSYDVHLKLELVSGNWKILSADGV